MRRTWELSEIEWTAHSRREHLLLPPPLPDCNGWSSKGQRWFPQLIDTCSTKTQQHHRRGFRPRYTRVSFSRAPYFVQGDLPSQTPATASRSIHPHGLTNSEYRKAQLVPRGRVLLVEGSRGHTSLVGDPIGWFMQPDR